MSHCPPPYCRVRVLGGFLCVTILSKLLHAAALVAFGGRFEWENWWLGSGMMLPISPSFDDVHFFPQMVRITLRYSKTDQKGKGVLMLLQSCAESALRPKEAVCHYLAVRGGMSGNFFQHQDGTSLTRSGQLPKRL